MVSNEPTQLIINTFYFQRIWKQLTLRWQILKL